MVELGSVERYSSASASAAAAPSPPLPMARKKDPRSKVLDENDSSGSKPEVCANPCVNHCCKRCASKRQTRYLPQEMFSNILLHLPAQGSNGVMRRLCREMNLMIRAQSQIHDHLRNSTGGIIIQERCSPRNGFYVEMRRGCLKMCKFDCGFGDLVWSSCNGLVLAPDCRYPHTLSIINPLTKEWAVLPPFFSGIGCYSKFSLAFVEASMEYKVVKTGGNDPLGLKPQIAVLTFGVDKVWRSIGIQHLSLETRGAFSGRSFVTGGYIHWTNFDFVLTLNVDTETIRRFPMPRLPGLIQFLPMGSSNLSIFSQSFKFRCDVWEMNPETGEWTMLLRFKLKLLNDRLKDLFCEYQRSIFPLGWLADREVLVFTTSCDQIHCVAYNIKTREILSLELDKDAKLYHFQAHVNSLLWLERGFQVDRLLKRQGIPISRLSCT